jgi:hypothetical protein
MSIEFLNLLKSSLRRVPKVERRKIEEMNQLGL